MAKKATQTETAERAAPLEGDVIAPTKNAMTVTPAIDNFMKELLPSKTARDISASLPEHISFDLFKRNLWNALAHNWKLHTCAPHLLVREVSKAAACGLLLDPMLGEAYLIIGYNGKTKQEEPQLRVGYKGLMKLARQNGNVAGLWCHEVHQNDHVEADMGFPKKYSHRPNLFSDDRGPIVGYTAVIAYKDDNFDFEPMTVKQCLDIRNRSDAWKAYEKGLIKSTPWATDEVEMCKKTVFNRLMKRQDKSPEMRAALEYENDAEGYIDQREELPPPRKAPAPPPEDAGSTASPRDLSSERTKSAPRGERTAPKPPVDEKPKAEPAKSPKLPMSTKELLAWIDQKLGEVTPELMIEQPDLLGNIWEVEITPRIDGLFPVDVDEAQAILRKHEKRLEP